ELPPAPPEPPEEPPSEPELPPAPTEPPDEPAPAQRITPEPVDPTATPDPGATATPTPDPGATATPTPDPAQPTATATPDIGVPTATPDVVPPTATAVGTVQINKIASDNQVRPGQTFFFVISVSTADASATVTNFTDQINASLEIVSVAPSGTCAISGQTVSCASLTAQNEVPAVVTIGVRALADTPEGAVLPNQASATFNSTTLRSNVVQVNVSGPPQPTDPPATTTAIPATATPTNTTDPAATATPTTQPDATATPTTDTPPPPPATNTPIPPTDTVPPGMPTSTPIPDAPTPTTGTGGGGGGGGGGGQATPNPTLQASVPALPPTPTLVPIAGTPQPTPIPPVVLPTEVPISPPIVAPPTVPVVPPVPQPTTPPVVFPTEAPGLPLPTTDPGFPIEPTSEPEQATETAEAATATAETLPTATSPAQLDGVRLRMVSDWGSAFPGQAVVFNIELTNLREPADDGSNDLRNIRVNSRFPANLDLDGATADQGGDPTLMGNDLSHRLNRLPPGETLAITVETRIDDTVTPGTLLVTQAQAEFDGASRPLLSNLVTVLVVNPAQQVTATAGAVRTATAQTSPTRTPTVPVAGDAGTPSPTATFAVAGSVGGAAGASGSPTAAPPTPTDAPAGEGGAVGGDDVALPETSTGLGQLSLGVSLFGWLLLGFVGIRRWRLVRLTERV
ncbi:MAG: hypothetical protein HC911_10950, partial [Chloroflexaceae bacterium]|nr:hypothetical protein [Chloroflexaceae bacterium]